MEFPPPGTRLSVLEAMKLAISSAKRGWGGARPNPHVGCVILSSAGDLVSVGYHAKSGTAHAEVAALSAMGVAVSRDGVVTGDISKLKGATVVVTLEPCAFEGRTGSCAKALAKLPIARLVYGLIDPHEKVSGQGLEILRNVNVKVQSWREAVAEGTGTANASEADLAAVGAALEEISEHFVWSQKKKVPFVALKVATTLDGIMAHSSGESKWITGEKAREEVHRLRAGFAAMLVGKNTFLRDNPFLNIRHGSFAGMQNKAIVLDSSGSALHRLRDSNLYKSHKPEDIFWIVDESFENSSLAEELGVQIIYGPVETALPQLYESGIDSIMVEGGARVLSYFIEHRLAQRLYHFIAPQVAGAAEGVAWTSQVKLNWDSRVRLHHVSTQMFGEDILLTGKF